MKSNHPTMLQFLEPRTLLSVSGASPPLPSAGGRHHPAVQAAAAPTAATTGLTLHLVAGVPFSGEVAFYPSPVLDPPLAYSATIKWGDGTTSQATLQYGSQGATGGYVIDGTHTYRKAGTYKIVTIVTTGPIITSGQPPLELPTTIVGRIKGKAIVSPFPPNSAGGVTIAESTGQSFTANVGSFVTLAPGTGLVATITWGDGTSSAGQLQAAGVVGLDEVAFNVVGTHSYALAGKYPIHILVTQPTPTPVAGAKGIETIASIESTAVVTDSAVLSLAGTLTGSYAVPSATATVGQVYHFTGTGDAGDMGAVTVSGSVSLPGRVATGQASGKLTLTNAEGSVTLQLTGPVEAGLGAFPATLNYLLIQGTGAYAGDEASGTLGVTLIPSTTAKGGSGGFTIVIA